MADPPPITLACLQARAVPCDVEANVAALAAALAAAAAYGARLLVAPELFLCGYRLAPDAMATAEPADGPAAHRLQGAVDRAGVAMVYGFAERDGETTYNAANLLRPDQPAVTYRKAHLFGGDEAACFTPGDALPLAEVAGVRVGLMICYDIEFPEAARAMALRGADVLAVPTANMLPFTEVPATLVRARACENALAVVYANHCGAEPPHTFTGGSAIVDATGRDAARAGAGPALLFATVDVAADRRHPAASTQLRDRRPELYEDILPVPTA